MTPSSNQNNETKKSKNVGIDVQNTIVIKPQPNKSLCTSFTFHEYRRDNIELAKYKLPALKQIAKHNKLTQTGTKATLTQKLHQFFITHLAASMIQKIMRGRFVRLVLDSYYRGNAFVQRNICVNETDFFTLEPLFEIPFQQFFSFTDVHAFTYGFDIQSLILLYRTKEKLTNPYNREEFTDEVYTKIFILYHLIRITFPNSIIPGDKYVSSYQRVRRTRYQRRTRQQTREREVIQTNATNENTVQSVHDHGQNFAWTQYQRTSVDFLSSELSPLSVVELMVQMEAKKQMMMQIQQKPPISRIQELFMEMDQLGNYTDAAWMLNLNAPSLHALYRHLVEIWRIRAQLPYEIRNRICPIEDPFLVAEPRIDDDIEMILLSCIRAMENMVFAGLDIEYRKIGAMHVLTALTMVSLPARNTFFWLFETML